MIYKSYKELPLDTPCLAPTRNDTNIVYSTFMVSCDPIVPCKRTNASRVKPAGASQRPFRPNHDMAPSEIANSK